MSFVLIYQKKNICFTNINLPFDATEIIFELDVIFNEIFFYLFK